MTTSHISQLHRLQRERRSGRSPSPIGTTTAQSETWRSHQMHKVDLRSCCVLLTLLMCSAHPRADEQSVRALFGGVARNTNPLAMQVRYSHLSIDSTIG